MNWSQVERQWSPFNGELESAWAKLTDHDLDACARQAEGVLSAITLRTTIVAAPDRGLGDFL